MKYPSRKDVWLTLLVWVPMLLVICLGVYSILYKVSHIGELLLIVFALVLFPISMLWMWCTTYYVIEEAYLLIRTGPFKKRILLHSIRSVRRTMNPISSPALSLRRVEVLYDQYGIAIISPKNREAFMEELKTRSPKIQVISNR